MKLTPQRLQALGDAGAKAALSPQGTTRGECLELCAEKYPGFWKTEAPARAAFAQAVLQEAGFYKFLDALKEAEAGLEIAVSELAGTKTDWPGSSPRKALKSVQKAIAKAEGGLQ